MVKQTLVGHQSLKSTMRDGEFWFMISTFTGIENGWIITSTEDFFKIPKIRKDQLKRMKELNDG